MRTIVTAALQRQYPQTELIFWIIYIYIYIGVSGGAVCRRTALQAGRQRVRFRMVLLEIFYSHNPSARTIALGLTQSVTEMSTRNISCGVKVASA